MCKSAWIRPPSQTEWPWRRRLLREENKTWYSEGVTSSSFGETLHMTNVALVLYGWMEKQKPLLNQSRLEFARSCRCIELLKLVTHIKIKHKPMYWCVFNKQQKLKSRLYNWTLLGCPREMHIFVGQHSFILVPSGNFLQKIRYKHVLWDNIWWTPLWFHTLCVNLAGSYTINNPGRASTDIIYIVQWNINSPDLVSATAFKHQTKNL